MMLPLPITRLSMTDKQRRDVARCYLFAAVVWSVVAVGGIVGLVVLVLLKLFSVI
jgi:hypothetical protein